MRAAADGARPGPPHRRLHGLRGRHPPGRGQRGAADREPLHRSTCDWERRGGPGPAPARADLQAESRRPAQLARFTKEARAELGAAGDHLLADPGREAARGVGQAPAGRAGTARAQALGWPDAYPFTKALGERALVDGTAWGRPPTASGAAHHRAALDHRVGPGRAACPGWIRGFRMAEPIIISYARGLLREFPGVPEGVIDVIPVDMVVAAILAVAAAGPDPAGPTRLPRGLGGARTRCATGGWSSWSSDWFSQHPLYDDRGQPISVPEWSFPGRGRVQRQLQRATRAMDAVERLLTALPVRGGRPTLSARLEDRNDPGQAGPRLRRALRRLHRDRGPLPGRPAAGPRGDPGRRGPRRLLLRPRRSSTGPTTSTTSTCRRSSSTPGSAPPRPARWWPAAPSGPGEAILSPDRHLAVFDLENTLIASNVVDTYAWLASRHLPAGKRADVRGRPAARGARRCWPSTAGTGATSCAPSTAATRAPRWPCSRTTPGSCSTASC